MVFFIFHDNFSIIFGFLNKKYAYMHSFNCLRALQVLFLFIFKILDDVSADP